MFSHIKHARLALIWSRKTFRNFWFQHLAKLVVSNNRLGSSSQFSAAPFITDAQVYVYGSPGLISLHQCTHILTYTFLFVNAVRKCIKIKICLIIQNASTSFSSHYLYLSLLIAWIQWLFCFSFAFYIFAVRRAGVKRESSRKQNWAQVNSEIESKSWAPRLHSVWIHLEMPVFQWQKVGGPRLHSVWIHLEEMPVFQWQHLEEIPVF